MKKFFCAIVLSMVAMTAVANPSVERVKAAHIVPASQWVDTTKVTTPKFVGYRVVDGVGKVALYKDDCGIYYRLRSTAKVELKKYVRPDLLATKVGK